MSDSKSVKQLCEENLNLNNHILSLSDVITELEHKNKELENNLSEIKKYYQSLDKFAATVYDPNKSTYKELEDKLALAETSKQIAIDDLYETKIGPLQNKVKDQHIQLESQYKRETKLQQQIKELEILAKDQQTIINYAAGYISACEQFRDKHPNDVKNWLFEGLK